VPLSYCPLLANIPNQFRDARPSQPATHGHLWCRARQRGAVDGSFTGLNCPWYPGL